jgi:VanZ family protein
MAIIFTLSAQTLAQGPHTPLALLGRKAFHFGEYALLAFLLFRAILDTFPQPPVRLVVIVIALCLGYAISDEWHQSFVPLRGASPLDVLIDGAGAIFGAGVSVITHKSA